MPRTTHAHPPFTHHVHTTGDAPHARTLAPTQAIAEAQTPPISASAHTLLATVARHLPAPLRAPLLYLSGLQSLSTLYDTLPHNVPPSRFAHLALEALGITTNLHGVDLQTLPPQGRPLIIVANHPFGALEGLILAHTLLAVRPDMRFLANFMLTAITELRDLVINVDPFGATGSQTRNLTGLRTAINHLRGGNALAIFPSGTVSHLHPTQRAITDSRWHRNVGRLVRTTGADVLPIHFAGRNSLLFNLAGLVHPSARTALLPKELLSKRDTSIDLTIGRIIPHNTLADLPDDDERTAYMRIRTYGLTNRQTTQPRSLPLLSSITRKALPKDIAAPCQSEQLEAEIANLPKADILHTEGDYMVLETTASQSPNLIHEIGRQREITFRAVGEGTGNALDLDTYDASYNHLILWHTKHKCIAGAYRLGVVSSILPQHGIAGLYSSTLFRIHPRFFDGPASMELGRAFVVAAYQRDYAPLLMLWKGIGRFLLKRPGISRLFGPVSVSLAYSTHSLRTIRDYMLHHHGCTQTRALVSGRTRPRLAPANGCSPLGPEHLTYATLCNLVRDMENGPSVPILFKHYLKLGGRIAAFHQDTRFGSLDGFLVLDLHKAPRKMLERYLGPDGTDAFVQAASSATTEKTTAGSIQPTLEILCAHRPDAQSSPGTTPASPPLHNAPATRPHRKDAA